MAQPESPSGPPASPPAAPPPYTAPYPPPMPPYYYPPRPYHSSNIVLIIVVVLMLIVVGTIVIAAILYVMVSGLVTGPDASKPVITFNSQVSLSGGVATVTIAGASQDVARDNYLVNLQVGATIGTATALAPAGTATNVPVGAATYTVTWNDIVGGNTVSAGDTFAITTTGGLPAATSFTFLLFWSDGSQIQRISWATP